MTTTLEQLILLAPTEREALMADAFPQARKLISDETYKSENDDSIFRRWCREVIEPAVREVSDAIKDSLRHCLEARGKAELAAYSAGINFVCGHLPNYPSGLAPTVAALIVLTAYELRDRGHI